MKVLRPMRSSSFALRSAGAVLLTVVAAAACSDGAGPEEKPTRADIVIEGTTPAPLQLVTSDDFFEELDPATLQPVQIFNTSDTVFVETLPYRQSVPIGELGSIVVQLTNFADEPAQVRMQIDLDSGQPGYDQSATMSEGGTLRYVFRFFRTVI